MDLTIHSTFLRHTDPDASLAFYRDAHIRVILATDNLDVTFAQVAATGAEVVQEPALQPYGVRDCAFRDPAGTLVRINEVR